MRDSQLSQIRNSPTAFSAAGLVVLELRLFIIVVQVALADYCFRVCLFSRDDVFLSFFRLSWIDRRQIVQYPDGTRVRQFRFRVGGTLAVARCRSSIRCQSRRVTFCLVECPFRVRACLVTRWDVSYLPELHAGSLLVCRGALVRLADLAKLQVMLFRPGLHLRPAEPMYPPQHP